MKIVFGAIALLVIFIASVAFKVSIWNECRETNSFFYCIHVISK
jgi:hypothetical protein